MTLVHELISKRWSPRAFSKEKVASEIVISILDAGRWAASSRNSQPWRFIIAEEGSEYWEDMIRGLIPFNQEWATKASFIILVVAQVEDANGRVRKDYKIDIGLAIGNMSMQAISKNVYLHNMTGIEKDIYRNVYNIPVNFEPVVAIAGGYLGNATQLNEALQKREVASRTRIPLNELIFHGKWEIL